MPKISAVVITFNEEKNIERCIKSLTGVVDEIVVVDSFSTDKTREICDKYNVTFVDQKWLGYSDSKNVGNEAANHDWILSIDADEALDDDLRTSVLGLKKKDLSEKDIFYFNRITNFCGKWIKHGGWYPEWKMRIWNRRSGKWEGDVHEEVEFNCDVKITKLSGNLLHYSYYTVSDNVQVIDKYTDIGAKRLFDKGKKSSICKSFTHGLAKFLKMYFLKRGFLDGRYGFIVAVNGAFYAYLKYAKLMILNKTSKK